MASLSTSLVSGREAFDMFSAQLMNEGLVDISRLGQWRLSSSRPGCGLRELLDNTPTTFWQSDGELPHSIEIQFSKFVEVSMIALFIDFREDESYTPSQVRIWAGFGRHDILEIDRFEIDTSEGWSCLLLGSVTSKDRPPPIKCMFLKIQIAQNHQNGKDTHVRGLRIVGPQLDAGVQKKDGPVLSPVGMRL